MLIGSGALSNSFVYQNEREACRPGAAYSDIQRLSGCTTARDVPLATLELSLKNSISLEDWFTAHRPTQGMRMVDSEAAPAATQINPGIYSVQRLHLDALEIL